MPRKRVRDEAELDISIAPVEDARDIAVLHRLRNTWQFACFMQYVHIFGSAVKIGEDLDIEELEEACLNPERAARLAQVGLQLLKFVSSHRGLTPELFDEYTRRQYVAKAPQRNPFGEEEEPKKFDDFDVFTKVKVLYQLSTWTLGNAERMRSLMPEKESEQTQWRIEAYGWDSDDRTYFLLDDDRLYRMTDAPIPPPPITTKSKSKAKPRRSRGVRSSKRRKLSSPDSDVDGDVEPDDTVDDIKKEDEPEENDFGGMKWECLAVTMEEYQAFLASISKSRDANERTLHKSISADVLPILERRAEAQRAKALKKQREFENIQKLATAKRSSRIAGRLEKQKEADDAADAERQRRADLEMARKEQERQTKLDEDRQSRMMTREQRLKEREVKRILHEEELARLEELKAKGEDPDARHSDRQLQSQLEKRQKELQELQSEEDPWTFDCSVCGMHGENIDDGTHSVACEKCNIWQHSKCHGIKKTDAERDDFHFVCADCKRKEEDTKKPRIPPLKLGRIGTSPSPTSERSEHRDDSNGTIHVNQPAGPSEGRIVTGVSILKRPQGVTTSPQSRPQSALLNGPSLSPTGQSPGPPGYQPVGRPHQVGVPQTVWQGKTLPPPQRQPAQSEASPMRSSPVLSSAHHTDRRVSPTLELHQEAHASAVASSHAGHQASATLANGHANGSMPPPSPHRHALHNGHHVPSSHPMQPGSSPSKPRQQPASTTLATPQSLRGSPNGHSRTQLNAFGLPQSPNATFPPPQNPEQRLAGQSPVKQPSPSPQIHSNITSQSPAPVPHPPAATPNSHHPAAPASTPLANILRASPHAAASSPIPPISAGPVIPTKHDTPRPPSRDSIAGTPVFPPAMALSPSAAQTLHGRGMGTEGGQGGLGTASIPVKKLPEQNGARLTDEVDEVKKRAADGDDELMTDV